MDTADGFVSVAVGDARAAGWALVSAMARRLPAQLPRAAYPFTNRVDTLARLDDLLIVNGHAPRTGLVSGVPGVGKSAVVVQWARAQHGRFLDGQLYARLGPQGCGAGEALEGFLAELGCPAALMPSTVQGRQAMYRTLTEDKDLLVMIDDAQGEADIELLTPSSPQAVVVVTSRQVLPEAIAGLGAEYVAVSPMPVGECVAMLKERLSGPRFTGQAAGFRELAVLCRGLPQAILLSAARLSTSDSLSVAWLCAELREAGAGGPVGRLLDLSCEALADEAAAVYRIAGLLGGEDLPSDLIEVAAGRPVLRDLRELTRLHLACETEPGRFTILEAAREHAAAAGHNDPAAALIACRAAGWAWQMAAAADYATTPVRLRYAPEPSSRPFSSKGQAQRWLGAHRKQMVRVVSLGAAYGCHELVWQLAEAMWALFAHRPFLEDWITVHVAGAAAAQESGAVAAEAAIRARLARGYAEHGMTAQAHEQAGWAVMLAQAAWDDGVEHRERLMGMAYEFQGIVHLHAGEPAAAEVSFRKALEFNESVEYDRGIALQSLHLGRALLAQGKTREAAGSMRRSVRHATDTGSEARACAGLGAVLHVAGETSEAAQQLQHALAIAEEHALVRHQGDILAVLAAIAADGGRSSEAEGLRARATAAYIEAGAAQAADA